MRSLLARKAIERMSARYGADNSYLFYLLRESPDAFWRFMRAGGMSRHRERVPAEASLTAQLVVAMYEDCGPCTQLFVRFAVDAKIPQNQIEAILSRNLTAMSSEVELAYRYATAVLNRDADADNLRASVRKLWGEKGLIDLAMAMQGARLYPMMKNALGYALTCQRVQVGDRWVTIEKHIT